MSEKYDPKEDLKEFFRILNTTEESDSGRIFNPVYISSRRVMLTEKLGKILKRLEDYSK